MKQKSQEYTFFKKEKKKYHVPWYFFFSFTLLVVIAWYRFCVNPFLNTSDQVTGLKITRQEHESRLRKATEQEAALSQAMARSFTQEKLMDLVDRAIEHDVTMRECCVQERSVQPHITKTTLLLKMEGDYIDIAQFLDSMTHDFLCTIDTLQMVAGQESYHTSVTLTCATLT